MKLSYIRDQNAAPERMNRVNYLADCLLRDRLPDFANTESHIRSMFDTTGAMFYARQLENVETQVYLRPYAELKARQVMPVISGGGFGITTHTYRTMDHFGSTVYIGSGQENDLPMTNVTGKEVIQNVKYFGNQYGYNVLEMRQAAIAGVPLEAYKAFATRDIIERKIEALAFFGDSTVGVKGLLVNADINRFTYAAGASTDTEWATKTPQEILFDVVNAIATMRSDTLDIETPDTLLIPSAQYTLLMLPRSDLAGESMLKWLISNIPDHLGLGNFTIMSLPLLSGTGLGGLDRSVFLRRNPEKLSLIIPADVMVLDPVRSGLSYDIPMLAGCGGAIVRYPLSIAFWDGL